MKRSLVLAATVVMAATACGSGGLDDLPGAEAGVPAEDEGAVVEAPTEPGATVEPAGQAAEVDNAQPTAVASPDEGHESPDPTPATTVPAAPASTVPATSTTTISSEVGESSEADIDLTSLDFVELDELLSELDLLLGDLGVAMNETEGEFTP